MELQFWIGKILLSDKLKVFPDFFSCFKSNFQSGVCIALSGLLLLLIPFINQFKTLFSESEPKESSLPSQHLDRRTSVIMDESTGIKLKKASKTGPNFSHV
jgi:hypothetical protein